MNFNSNKGKATKLRLFADDVLGGSRVPLFVKIPAGVNTDEWIAYNLQGFFKSITLVYGCVLHACTVASCPRMTAANQEFLWKDDNGARVRLPAPTYVDRVMTWAKAYLNDERYFPTEIGTPFPDNFLETAKLIFTRLFRVYAHIFYHHYTDVGKMEMYLMTTFQHYVFFGRDFNLLDEKTLLPMKELIDEFDKKEAEVGSAEANEFATA